MVKSFRVAELKELLLFGGMSTKGQKPELLLRAIKLLSDKFSTELSLKVAELNKKRWGKKTQNRTKRIQPTSKPQSKLNILASLLSLPSSFLSPPPSSFHTPLHFLLVCAKIVTGKQVSFSITLLSYMLNV